MSQENVETIRGAYAAYNAAFGAPNPQEAIRASLERFFDPEIEFELDPIVSIDRQIYYGIDGVMEFIEVLLQSFEEFRQMPERFIDCGDRVMAFTRIEARGRSSGLDINEQWAHLLTLRDGKIVRLQQFRDRDEGLEAAGLSE
jgi:uncharacterized protein